MSNAHMHQTLQGDLSPGGLLHVPLFASERCHLASMGTFGTVGPRKFIQHLALQLHFGISHRRKGDPGDDHCPARLVGEVQSLAHFAPVQAPAPNEGLYMVATAGSMSQTMQSTRLPPTQNQNKGAVQLRQYDSLELHSTWGARGTADNLSGITHPCQPCSLADGVPGDLQTAKKMAPCEEGSSSLARKSWAAAGKSAASRGSTTACFSRVMRSQMLVPG